jgi:death on curing protein
VSYLWPDKAVVLAIHDAQLAEHGGPSGLRDDGLLESALVRPTHHVAYNQSHDIADVAAILAHGLACNHAFVDGNKRVSAVVTELFFEMNGYEFAATDPEIVTTWRALAAGELSASDLATWIRQRLKRIA